MLLGALGLRYLLVSGAGFVFVFAWWVCCAMLDVCGDLLFCGLCFCGFAGVGY